MVYEARASELGAITSSSFPGGLLLRRSPESARWPLPSAQRASELPGLPGPRQGETRHSLPGPVTASWGVRDSSGGGGSGLRRTPSSPSLLPPQPHPLGSWAEPGSDPGQVAWPLCLSPFCLTRGHHGLQVGCQASLGDSDRTGSAPPPPQPPGTGSGICRSSGRRAACRAAEAEGGRAAGCGRGRGWGRRVSGSQGVEEGCVPAEEAGLGQAGLRVGGAGGVGVSSLSPDMWVEPQDAHPESGEGSADVTSSGEAVGCFPVCRGC